MRPFDEILQKVDFTPENGLVRCDEPGENIDPGEFYYIHEKAKKLGVNAVLFRRKYNAENEIIDSQPVLFIFEKEDSFFDSQGHKDLQAKIWSAGEIEVYFIISKTRIDIFNARKPAEIIDQSSQTLSVKNLRLVSKAIEEFNDQRFSAIVFGKGIFWEQTDFSNQLSEENAPFYRLLEYLMAVRRHLHTNQSENLKDTIDKLLIISILVKFLEEIKDDNGKHTLRKIYKTHNITSFAEALEKGICFAVLQELAPEFNGHIFNKFSDKEKQQIKHASLKLIADFLNATIDINTQQTFLWEQYSFHHLPVELISAIYENFLPKEKGVVYTPPFLVNFLVDEVMPLKKASEYFSQNNYKVLDPSCGSGIFLVAAYKRMLQWWSINQYKEKNEIKFPDKKICQEILEQNIYGVDKHPTATLITVFSLTITLLDKLEPKEIWTKLKLNSLQNNIKTQDFFEWAVANVKDKKFDLVIGNPPFNPLSGTSKKGAVSDDQIKLYGIRNKDIPDNNFALKFFEGAIFFGKKVCLIVPSNVLLYNKAQSAHKYRKRLFTQFTIETIFDFTHLRRELFGSADTPVCAVVAYDHESEGKLIEHTVIKRTISTEKKISFEIDHYDRHFVRHDWATDPKKQFIWKTNLLGGGRLFHFIYRLSLLPTLKTFVHSRTGWKEDRGFEGGSKFVVKNQDQIISLTETGEPDIERNIDIHSDRLKDPFMYEPPFMIVDQILGKKSLSACFIPKNNNFTQNQYLYYNRDFIGISCPEEDENELKDIFNFMRLKNAENQLNNQLFTVSISSNCLVLHETAIRKGDILSLPYFPDHEQYLQLSKTEKILQDDVLQYYINLGKAISEKGEGRTLHEKVGQKQLENFGITFCEVLNPIYAKNGKSWQYGKFYQTQSFTIYQFGYGKDAGLTFQMPDDLDDILIPLIYNSFNRGAIFTRVCRFYKHINGYDCVFLMKPNALRYWLNSIALRDADETFMDLKEAGR